MLVNKYLSSFLVIENIYGSLSLAGVNACQVTECVSLGHSRETASERKKVPALSPFLSSAITPDYTTGLAQLGHLIYLALSTFCGCDRTLL